MARWVLCVAGALITAVCLTLGIVLLTRKQLVPLGYVLLGVGVIGGIIYAGMLLTAGIWWCIWLWDGIDGSDSAA